MNITWLGHSTFLFTLGDRKNVLIDPWIHGNPKSPQGFNLPHIDAMLLSHGHGDHTGDAIAIAKKDACPVVCNFEISLWLASKGIETARPMNKGGAQTVAGLRVTMTHAFHSSSMQDGEHVVYGGEAAGYIIELPDGRRIYFAGDTNVFGDMRLIARLYEPDLAILPIGDLYTMGPKEAAIAVEFLGVKHVIPMHYGTFPPLTGTPEALQELVGSDVEVIELKPGEAYAY
ncbi:MAG: metal-dependent hydrolase [Bryobacterales bacterium]|nr:metal-dependent hydrolase [Bryobacterales bacterium]